MELPEKLKFNPRAMEEYSGDETDEKPQQKAIVDLGPTRKEIMAQLDAAGVKYKSTESKAALQALLDQVKPAGTTVVESKEFEVGIV